MSIYETLRNAVLPIVDVCEPDFYEGDADIYCTYNASELPTAHGDDAPHALRYLVQLHLYLPGGPKRPSPMALKRQLCRAVLEAGFTYPTVTNASDRDTQHYVLEFEGVDGEV